MSNRTQFDPTIRSRDLDLPLGKRGNRKKKKRVNAKDRRVIQLMDGRMQAKIDKDRRLMYIDNSWGISNAPQTIIQNTTTTFGVLINPSNIAVGNSQATRVSDQVWLSKLHVNCNFIYNFGASGSAQDYVDQIRMTVFIWHPNSSSDPVTPAQLFQNVSATTSLASFDFELQKQFRVICDDYVVVSGFGDATTGFNLPTSESLKHIDRTFGMGNTMVRYTPGATTASNHVYVAFTSNTTTGPAPLIQFISRLYYYNDSV